MPAIPQIQPIFAIDDEELAVTDLTSCHLLILAGQSQFKYAVLDPVERKFIALKTYQDASLRNGLEDLELIESCFDSDKLLYTAFKHTRIAFNSHRNVLVPAPLYSVTGKKEPLSLLHGEATDEVVLMDEVPALDLMNVYAVHRNILGFLKKEFPAAVLCHAVTPLLTSWNEEVRLQKEAIFILVQPSWFHVLAFCEGKLMLQQQTRYSGTSDVVYHVLNIIRQLNFLPATATIYIAGDSSENADIFEGLGQFIAAVRWLERPQGFRFAEKFTDYPSSYFYHLFTVASCGL
jgi:hypothetical protein